MESKAKKFTLLLILISVISAYASLKLLDNIDLDENFIAIYLVRDSFFIITASIGLIYFLTKNNKENQVAFEEFRRKNLEVQEAKERYDIVAKATSDTIWDWKINENIFTWNKGILGIYGYKREDIENSSKWWFDRIHPEDSVRMSVNLYSFLERKIQKWQDEYRFRCKDGSYKYVLDRGFLVLDDDGTPLRMIGAMQDITSRKNEEQRLKLLETVITNTKDAVLITDADTSTDQIPKIIYVNEAFSRMSGFDYEEAIRKSPIYFYGHKSNNKELQRLLQCIKDKVECEIEVISYKKDNQEYWVRFSMVPVFNIEKEHTHWILIQRDVTQQKLQEEEREQLISKLTKNNEDLRQFSYIISHNFRSPLSNLIGLLKLTEYMSIDNEELKMIIDGFSKSTHLLNETITDLGEVMIIRDNPYIEKQNVLLLETINNIMNQISLLIKEAKPVINIEIQDKETLYTNKTYLESILINLLTNAINYRAKERILQINIKTQTDKDFTTLIVEDNGIGIDLKKYSAKIFGLYQKFHDYPDSKGLGLYLVKSHIESLGGKIEIESEVNLGTKFLLKFKNNQ